MSSSGITVFKKSGGRKSRRRRKKHLENAFDVEVFVVHALDFDDLVGNPGALLDELGAEGLVEDGELLHREQADSGALVVDAIAGFDEKRRWDAIGAKSSEIDDCREGAFADAFISVLEGTIDAQRKRVPKDVD